MASCKSVYITMVFLTFASGSSAVSAARDLHLVQNLTTGCFDLLQLQDDTKLFSIPVFTRSNCVKQCEFSEDDRVAILGSEDGTVRVIDVRTGYLIQTMDHGGGTRYYIMKNH